MQKRLPAEFEKQSFVQIIFPHKQSDWVDYLQEAQNCFINIANAISKYEKCLIICDSIKEVKKHFNSFKNLYFIEYKTDDTWARDCSAISVIEGNEVKLLDFTFNGWGGKFESSQDNAMSKNIDYKNELISIEHELEGGAIDSNGKDVLLTTSECLLNSNRTTKNKEEIEKNLAEYFGIKRVLWLNHGYLAGDDTDSHVDTLARFIDERTIMYVKCEDADDEHYNELKKMEKELQSFECFKLVALPMCESVYFEGERLPATYANFLIINSAVLVPTYNSKLDKVALSIFRESFPNREIVAVDCSVLIRQHGSLHCVTMQFYEGVKLP